MSPTSASVYALNRLRTHLPHDAQVSSIVTHTNQEKTLDVVAFLIPIDDELRNVSYLIADVLDLKRHPNRAGITVGRLAGGHSSGRAVVTALSELLHSDPHALEHNPLPY